MNETINKAIEKIDSEAEKLKSQHAKIIASHIIDRYLKDEGNANKVLADSKSLNKCLDAIRNKAKKMATNQVAVVEDDTVFGWAAEYYGFEQTQSGKIIDLFEFL